MGQGASNKGAVEAKFSLEPEDVSDDIMKLWPFDGFGLIYTVTLDANSLSTICEVRNSGSESFEFNILLHSYLHVKVSKLMTVLLNSRIFRMLQCLGWKT
jgi:glucose-6-phosphate 1-epimerase